MIKSLTVNWVNLVPMSLYTLKKSVKIMSNVIWRYFSQVFFLYFELPAPFLLLCWPSKVYKTRLGYVKVRFPYIRKVDFNKKRLKCVQGCFYKCQVQGKLQFIFIGQKNILIYIYIFNWSEKPVYDVWWQVLYSMWQLTPYRVTTKGQHVLN